VSTVNTRAFTLDEVVRIALERRMADVHVALPASIVSYDAPTQTATVRPLLKGTAPSPTGIDIAVTLPDVYSVPILFVGGGGARATFPVAAGDMALLVFSDRALDRWKSLGAGTPPAALDPQANNQHSLSDAVAIVGLRALGTGLPWTNAPTDRVTLGYDAGSRIEVLAARINLGVGASEALVKGTSYSTHATALATAMTALATAMTTQATASVGPLAALNAGFTAAALAATNAATAATNLAGDVSAAVFTS